MLENTFYAIRRLRAQSREEKSRAFYDNIMVYVNKVHYIFAGENVEFLYICILKFSVIS
jgi:hypothetical protein